MQVLLRIAVESGPAPPQAISSIGPTNDTQPDQRDSGIEILAAENLATQGNLEPVNCKSLIKVHQLTLTRVSLLGQAAQ